MTELFNLLKPITEYNMTDDFVCIKDIQHTSRVCSIKSSPVIEKVFIPKEQNYIPTDLTLF